MIRRIGIVCRWRGFRGFEEVEGLVVRCESGLERPLAVCKRDLKAGDYTTSVIRHLSYYKGPYVSGRGLMGMKAS